MKCYTVDPASRLQDPRDRSDVGVRGRGLPEDGTRPAGGILERPMTTLLDHLNLVRLRRRGFKSVYVGTPHGRVHALVRDGSGTLPPVVLVAGLSSRATHFNRLVPHLRDEVRRIVLLDLPGHGLSDVPPEGLTGPRLQASFIAALDQLIDEPAVVFGNSLGGFMALRHALHSPDKVRGLVLASPGGADMDPMSHMEFLQRFRLRSHREALSLIDRVFCRAPMGVRQVMAFFARRQLTRPHIQHLVNSARPEDLLTSEELGQLAVPVRLLWGDADGVLPPAHRLFFKRALPHAQWVHPPDYGHSPYIERPDHVAGQILEFAQADERPTPERAQVG